MASGAFPEPAGDDSQADMATKAEPLGRQALKTKLTREKIIGAVISLIKEGGFAAASSSRIAERAGITWGAVQHHFGSKEDILDAILQLSYDQFLETMSTPKLRSGSLQERVDLFIDRMWLHYQEDIYLVALEILMGTRGDKEHRMRSWEERQGRAHLQVLHEVFHDSKLSDAKIREAITFAHCCLSGLGIEGLFETKVRNIPRHLQRVKTVLVSMLSGD